MANTTNYNWETPDDTDLVKDGAAAIRTLGNSIDTTTKNLNPETTTGDIAYRSATANTNTRLPIGSAGQVLTVAAGVPSWATPTTGDIEGVTAGTGISGGGTSGTVTITNSMATAIDAKGDLIVGTGADTFSRLAVGTNGQVLTADSSEATGLKFATPAGGGKVLQVVQATYATATTISSTSWTDTGLTGSITPSSASSKVLVMVMQPFNITRSTTDQGGGLRLMRGATFLVGDNQASAPFMNLFIKATGATFVQLYAFADLKYLDSPATTSSVTYKTQAACENTSSTGSCRVNALDTTATLIMMEIGA